MCVFTDFLIKQDINRLKFPSCSFSAYEKFKIPVPFAKGNSILLPFLPKKVKLTHYVDGPYFPPKYTNETDLNTKIDEFHKFICEKMTKLLESHGNNI